MAWPLAAVTLAPACRHAPAPPPHAAQQALAAPPPRTAPQAGGGPAFAPARPLSPAEALRTFALPPGFRIELVAAEPQIVSPVAMAFDEAGRLYVAEMADYPDGPPRGRIKRLEDRDGDGRMDRAEIFAVDLPSPLGLEPWNGGLLVAVAPDILFLADRDGDGRADERRVVVTGFRPGNPQHRVNNLRYGLDNWIYGANGGSGGDVIRPGGGDAALSLRGSDFRFRPDGSALERVAGPSQFANAFDDWGRRFVNDNSHHIRFPPLPLKELARNPALAVAFPPEEIADHGAAGEVFPTSPLAARFNEPGTAGHFTSASALTMYRAALFPEPFRGNAFVCEPVHNLVHRDLLVDDGPGFRARRGEAHGEFLTSTDPWFRPVNLAVGPEGALYVADFYRAVIEHPEWIPLAWQRRLDLRAGEDRGRIYRIVTDGPTPPPVRLTGASDEQLVATLGDRNGWVRTTAQRLLVEGHRLGAVPALTAQAQAGPPLARLHALWTLEGLGRLSTALVEAALGAPEAPLRENAVRLAAEIVSPPASLVRALAARAADPDAKVRVQTALALGALPPDDAREPLARLAARDGGHPWFRAALLSSLPPREAARFVAAWPPGLAGASLLPVARDLGAVVAASSDRAALEAWVRLAAGGRGAPAPWQLVALAAVAPHLRTPGAINSALGPAHRRVDGWTSRFVARALDRGRPPGERVDAVAWLALRPTTDLAARLAPLLVPQEPVEVQAAVARALAEGADAKRAGALLGAWSTQTAAVRRELLAALLSRPDGAGLVLDAVERGTLPPTALEPTRRQALLADPRPAVQTRSRRLLAPRASTELARAVAETTARVLPLAGDPVRGERTYLEVCASCHRRYAQGARVGPGLESVSDRPAEAILTDLLDPNRAVDPAYQAYTVKTRRGDELTGVIAAETPTGLTLRRPLGEEVTVLRQEIAEVQALPQSLMPEGFDKALAPQTLADLLAFLRSRPASRP